MLAEKRHSLAHFGQMAVWSSVLRCFKKYPNHLTSRDILSLPCVKGNK